MVETGFMAENGDCRWNWRSRLRDGFHHLGVRSPSSLDHGLRSRNGYAARQVTRQLPVNFPSDYVGFVTEPRDGSFLGSTRRNLELPRNAHTTIVRCVSTSDDHHPGIIKPHETLCLPLFPEMF